MGRKVILSHASLLLLLLAALLAACQLSPEPAPPAATTGEPIGEAATTRPSVAPAATTPSPTATATLPATATSTATAPPSITPTIPPSATATPTALPTPVRFAVIGDYGQAGQPAADVAALVKSWAPAFIITTGDNNYPDGAAATIDDNIGQYYADFIFPYAGAYGPGAEQNRFFPSMGNHDWYTPGAEPYLDYFALPGNERYYDFTWGPVHLFAVNSDWNEPDGIRSTSEQALWLQAGLAASDAPWKIVYMHVPPYSSGHHGSLPVMRWPFEEWGASAVLSGHDHVYERLLINGFPYFVNGLGGNGRYPFQEPLPGSQVRFNTEFGAMLVEATADYLTFQFVTRHNELIDSYTLTR